MADRNQVDVPGFTDPAAVVLNEVNASVDGVVIQARTIIGDIHLPAAPPEMPAPRQLPPPPAWFTDRTAELAALTETLERPSPVVVTAVAGAGGIGKTALALHWAHQNADQFPDGQLFVDLRGFDPAGEPLPPAVAVRGFLDALGVAAQSVPVDLDAQVGRYRRCCRAIRPARC